MIWTTYLIVISYVIMLLWLLVGSQRLPVFLRKDVAPNTFFSVVVVFRNEASNLPLLLQSIRQLNYPTEAYELLFVDDASSDASSEVIHRFFKQLPQFNYRVIHNIQKTTSAKKDGITMAISQATHDWIVTTDADCQVPSNWLSCLNDYIQTEEAVCIAGPVLFKSEGGFLQEYQQYDGLSLQAVAKGSFGHHQPLVCNGANFCYRKDVFYKVGAFEGNTHLASGDDVFLLEKIQAHYPTKVRFLNSPDAIVTTLPEQSWEALLQQRIRWASKSTQQKNRLMKLVGGIVILTNVLIVLSFFASLALWFSWTHFFILLTVKIIADVLVLFNTRAFYEVRFSIVYAIVAHLIYPWFTVLVIAKSISGQVMWKDRPIKKQGEGI